MWLPWVKLCSPHNATGSFDNVAAVCFFFLLSFCCLFCFLVCGIYFCFLFLPFLWCTPNTDLRGPSAVPILHVPSLVSTGILCVGGVTVIFFFFLFFYHLCEIMGLVVGEPNFLPMGASFLLG